MPQAMIQIQVTYTVEKAGRIYVIEHVPARVCKETGEQFFDPQTVRNIQALINNGAKPARMIQAPVQGGCAWDAAPGYGLPVGFYGGDSFHFPVR